MEARGDNLIIVPCWWEGDVDSLVALIRNTRHDLLTDRPIVSAPIPSIPPDGYFKVLGVPGVGELMVASFPRVSQFSIIGWWISEKYDGVRVCWNGSKRMLYSRYGRLISLPSVFASTFPSGTFLDIEAWVGRGGFNEAQTIINKQVDDFQEWAFFRMPIFDTPDPKLVSLGYEKRMIGIFKIIPIDSPILVIVSNLKCKNDSDLTFLTHLVLQHEGEGIISRKPLSTYWQGLSDALWKFKASRDMEALVIEEAEAEDGYFTLKLSNEITFKAQMKKGIAAPTVGQVVSLSYSKYSPTVGPINALIERVRIDIEWDEVTENHHMLVTEDGAPAFKHKKGEGPTLTIGTTDKLHAGYWTYPENVKQFFDSIAQKYNFDPNDPMPWYNYSIRDIVSEGGGSMLARYSQSPLRALRTAYPNSDFVPHMFTHVPKNHWASPENRRQYLLHFAQKKGFDAFVAEHWYKISVKEIIDVKGGAMVLSYHDNSLAKTLCELLPDIGLNWRLFKTPRGYFTSISMQRAFLENFANKMGFHPLKASGWRNVTKAEILSEPGGPTLINKYKTLPSALSRLFPELDSKAFRDSHPRMYWSDSTNQKTYFDTIAQQRKFDPLIAESWYSVTLQTYAKYKGYKSILNFYNGSIAEALQQCFPNIGLDLSRLKLLLGLRDDFKNT
eukprot:Phypoly_transcript_03723.p1 GENE.Phypoly_transcript_03723~~Phypoly_transcript_03723.p1  ORF type:complete len:701 (+),score=48.32 Phypoly_transcript_03723:95-2104(+)